MPPAKKLSWRRVQVGVLAGDVVMVGLGLFASYVLRYHGIYRLPLGHPLPGFHYGILVLIGVGWLAALLAFGLYRRANLVSGIDEYRRVANAGLVTVLTIVIVVYLTISADVSRGFIALALVLVTGLVWAGRFSARRLIYRAATRGRFLDRVLVVGANRQAIAVADQLRSSPAASCDVVGFVSDYVPVGTTVAGDLKVLGEPMELETVAARAGANKAVVVEIGLSWESLRYLVTLMHLRGGMQIALVPGLFDLHATAMTAHNLGPIMTLVPEPSRIVGFEAAVKRALDLGLVAVAMVVALPLMLLLVLAALLSGHGSGLTTRDFVAEGRRLRLVHFARPAWAKRTHLSRLPDLFQVILGRMSILGPRPIESGSAESYAGVTRFLETVKPGFIGPWWLVGKGRPEEMEAELAFDLYYLRNYSVWLDAQILLKVALALLGRSPELSFGPDVSPTAGLEPGAGGGQRGGVAREPVAEGSVRD